MAVRKRAVGKRRPVQLEYTVYGNTARQLKPAERPERRLPNEKQYRRVKQRVRRNQERALCLIPV